MLPNLKQKSTWSYKHLKIQSVEQIESFVNKQVLQRLGVHEDAADLFSSVFGLGVQLYRGNADIVSSVQNILNNRLLREGLQSFLVDNLGQEYGEKFIRLLIQIPQLIAFVRNITQTYSQTIKKLGKETIFEEGVIKELIILGTKDAWQY